MMTSLAGLVNAWTATDVLVYPGFFPGGVGVPPGSENFVSPPNRPSSPLFDQSLSPNWVLSPKISKILPNFSLNFDYFLAQNCTRKLYFMLKTPKFAQILL